MAMELPINREEWNAYQNLITSSKDGAGTIYTGGYYHLTYEPYTPDGNSLKCEGVILTIRRNKDNIIEFCDPVTKDMTAQKTVPFREQIGWVESIDGKVARPFRVRLKEAITLMTGKVKSHDEHNQRVKETAEKVVKCKVNIDSLISELTGGQSVPLSKMIEAQAEQPSLPEAVLPEPEPEPEKLHFFVKEDIKPLQIITDLEQQNEHHNINVVIDHAEQSKRANSILLSRAHSW